MFHKNQIIFIISLMMVGCNSEGETIVHHDCKLPMHQRIDKSDRQECQQIIPMYSFNTNTKNCETKTEKGCPQNLNSFNSYYTCMSYCIRPNNTQRENCNKLNLTTNCGNFEHKYFKYYFDRGACEQFTGNCQFNGNHFHNTQHCETVCGQLMEPTKKGHFLNINYRRKSWCFERFSFNVDDKCIFRGDDPNQSKVKYRFDYRENSCKMLETSQCTFNGNVFNTIEECVSDCWPSKFECQNCEKNVFINTYKAKGCKSVVEGRLQCNIRQKIFNWTALAIEVEKIRTSSALSMSLANILNVIISIPILQLRSIF